MSVPLVLVYQTLSCIEHADKASSIIDHMRMLMPRYDRDVPNHIPVDLSLVSNVVTCSEMHCVAPLCQCTQVAVPQMYNTCRRVPIEEAWARFPHQKLGFGSFVDDSSTKESYLVELEAFPGLLVVPRFAAVMIKLLVHRFIPSDFAIVSDVDVAFVSELNELIEILSGQSAMIAAVEDTVRLYDGAHFDVMHTRRPVMGGLLVLNMKAIRASNFDAFLTRQTKIHALDGPVLLPEQDILNEYAVKNPDTIYPLPCSWAWLVPGGPGCDLKPDILHGFGHREGTVVGLLAKCRGSADMKACLVTQGRSLEARAVVFKNGAYVYTKTSKKGLLGLLGLLGLIPLFLCLLCLCLCCLRRKRRGQAMMFSTASQPLPPPMAPSHVHAPPMGAGLGFPGVA